MRRGLFFGNQKRNDNYRLRDPHPLTEYGDDVCKGDAGLDGYTVLSRADPEQAGQPPSVEGTEGPTYRGPDQSFEQ